MHKQFSTIEDIISDLKKGGMVILTDDENRENEGDIVLARLGRGDAGQLKADADGERARIERCERAVEVEQRERYREDRKCEDDERHRAEHAP